MSDTPTNTQHAGKPNNLAIWERINDEIQQRADMLDCEYASLQVETEAVIDALRGLSEYAPAAELLALRDSLIKVLKASSAAGEKQRVESRRYFDVINGVMSALLGKKA